MQGGLIFFILALDKSISIAYNISTANILQGGANLGSLKKLRRERGRSQKQVASAAGITQGAYSLIETGANGLNLETARRIATYLSISVGELYDALERRE